MLKFHQSHKYLALIVLAAAACESEDGGGNVETGDASADAAVTSQSDSTSVSSGASSSGSTVDLTIDIDSNSTDFTTLVSSVPPANSTFVPVTTDSTASDWSTDGPVNSTEPASTNPSSPTSSDGTSTDVASTDVVSAPPGTSVDTSVPPYGSSSSTPPVDTSGTSVVDTSTPPADTSDVGVSSDDAGVTEVVDSGGPGVVFADDFEGETIANGKYQFNYTTFTHWNVTSGNVDLIAFPNELLQSPGGYGPGEPASGVTVDLNGSNANPGVLETKDTFTFYAGVSYELGYSLGSPYTETNGVRVEVVGGVFTQEVSQTGILPYTEYSQTFVPETTTTARLRFVSLGNNDNVGLVLDSVVLTRLD